MSVKGQKVIRGSVGPGLSILGSEVASKAKEEADKIQQDIFLITQRIADLKGEPIPVREVQDASPFALGVRALADHDRKQRDKSQQLELLLEKVSEYDRLVLARTAPAENSNGPQRRKSFGSDLYTLPTHFRLVDRLVDLNTQSKRVAVIRTTAESSSSTSSARATPTPPESVTPEIMDLRAQVQQLRVANQSHEKRQQDHTQQMELLQKKCEEVEARRKHQELTWKEEKESLAQRHLQELHEQQQRLAKQQQTLPDHTADIEKLKALLQQQQADHSAQTQEWKLKHSQIEASWQEQLAQVEQKHSVSNDDLLAEIRRLTQRLEAEVAVNAAVLSTLQGQSAQLASASSSFPSSNPPQMLSQVPPSFQQAFRQFQSAIDQRFASFRSEVMLLLHVKDALESDLKSTQTQRDIVVQDLHSVQEEHEALKTAYHALSYESATSSRFTSAGTSNKQQSAVDAQKVKDLEEEVQRQRAIIESMQGSLDLQRSQLSTLEKWPALVTQLEDNMRTVTATNVRVESELKAAKAEVEQYSMLNEKLKDKLRAITMQQSRAPKDSNNSEFLDSFEEVLKDELHSMKAAFEAKLRAAREEADALSKKHAVEIHKMQQSPSFGSLPRLPHASGK